MIDFTKITITTDTPTMLTKEFDSIDLRNGRKTIYNRNLVLNVYESGRVELLGSLHKYWNGGGHNYNDFGRVDLWDTIVEVCQWLNVAPQHARLHNLEFGLNMVVNFDVSEFLGRLVAYKDKPFESGLPKVKGTFLSATKDRYLIKAYDKGRQYGQLENILRFEVKVLKMAQLAAEGVQTLADLMQPHKLDALGQLLAEAWHDCILIETLDRSKLTKPETKIYDMATDTKSWAFLTNAKQRSRLKVSYENLLAKYANGGTKNEVGAMLKTKWCDLLQMPKSWAFLTKSENANMSVFHSSDKGLILDNSAVFQNEQNSSKTGRCLATDVSIIHQRKGSKFVGEKTVLNSDHLNEVLIVKRKKYRRKQHWRPPEYYGSHNARNDYWNLTYRIRHAEAEGVGTLFDMKEFVKLNPQQQMILERYRKQA